jgi:hypothetical protein
MAVVVSTSDVVLTTAATVVVNTAVNAQWVILKATATNTDTAAHQITTYRVPSGGSAQTGNIFGADALNIGAGVTVTLPIGGHGLINGQSLQALADANSVLNLNLTLAQVQ